MNDFNPDDWDFHWSKSDEITSANPGQRYRHRIIANMVRELKPQSLIDIGCGQGDFLQRLHHDFPNIELAGIELSQTGVTITKNKVPIADIIQFNLLSDSEVFGHVVKSDVGTCIEVIEHLDNPQKFLLNAKKFINQDGYLIVSVPSGPRTAYDKHIGHRRHFTQASLGELLTDSGYTVVGIRRYGWPFFNLYRFIVLLRGKKLIEEVASKSINDSKAALIISKVFDALCNFNISSRFVGWQLIAICKNTTHLNG